MEGSPPFFAYGVDTRHDLSFAVDRPAPHGAWVVSCFRSPVEIRTSKGLELGAPGDCIVIDPASPEWYRAAPGAAEGYRNDWIHVEAPDLDEAVKALGLPLGVLIPTGEPDFLADLLERIGEEGEARRPLWEAEVELSLRQILLRIARAGVMRDREAIWPQGGARYRERFVELREDLKRDFGRRWTIDELAAAASLSPSRFSVLYRKFFGVSPIDDLIQSRLSYACRRLLTSDVTLDSLAEECGFGSSAYLCRIFSRRLGCSPSSFRRSRR
jgi:AraC-like DNA-binding protein